MQYASRIHANGQESSSRPRVGLALSGGIARGPVHVGVLSALAHAGIPIDCIAGASAGSLVGAAYCAGLSMPRMRQLALQTGWRHVVSLNWPRRGLISFERLEPFMVDWLGDLRVESLPVPFAAVATDLHRGEQVVLTDGRLATAVHASCAVPGIVAPVEVNERLLCDGGISDNLPVDAARMLGADYVIGVDLFVPSQPRWGPLGIGATALQTLVRQAGGGYKEADHLIVPDLCGRTYFKFSQARAYMAIGEAAVAAALPQIRRDLADWQPPRRPQPQPEPQAQPV